MQQLFFTEFKGHTIPIIMRGGKPLFAAQEALLAVGYNKAAIAQHLSYLVRNEKLRVTKNIGWLEDETKETLFDRRTACRVMLTLDGIRTSLRRIEKGKGLELLKHINEVVVPSLEPSYLTPKAA